MRLYAEKPGGGTRREESGLSLPGLLRVVAAGTEHMSEGSKPYDWPQRIVLPAQDLEGGSGFQLSRPDKVPDADAEVAWRQ